LDDFHEFISRTVLAMMKTKGKRKATGKKKTGKKKAAGRNKKESNPAEVLKKISQMVMEQSAGMTEGQIGQGKAGAVAPYKFLLEMAGVYPKADDTAQVTKREESLAETLLDRLGIPKTPVAADEYGKEDITVIPANALSNEEELGEEDDEEELEEKKTTVVG
jgi:hypothetical protein